MKTTITENNHGVDITLEPETVEDFAQLARFAKNAKKEPASIYLSFNNRPHLSIWMRKIHESKQRNSIKPYETKLS